MKGRLTGSEKRRVPAFEIGARFRLLMQAGPIDASGQMDNRPIMS